MQSRIGQVVYVSLFACLALQTPALAEPRASRDRKDDVIEAFDVARRGDFLLIPVTIAETTYKFAVDTGSTLTVFDTELREMLTETAKRGAVNGKSVAPLYEAPRGRVGKSGLELSRHALCLDLAPIRRLSGQKIDGFLGMDFLRQYAVRIDFDSGRLSIMHSGSGKRAGGMKLSWDRLSRPTLAADVGAAIQHQFLIDTGSLSAGACSIMREVFDDLVERDQVEVYDVPSVGVSVHGRTTGRGGVLRRLRVADFEHQQLIVTERDENAFGLTYLSRYVVTLDFPAGVVHLDRGARYAAPQQFDMAGVVLASVDGRIVIDAVRPGGAADAAGLQPGDQVLQVDEAAANKMSKFELQEVLATPGRRVHLVVRRSTGVVAFDFTLETE